MSRLKVEQIQLSAIKLFTILTGDTAGVYSSPLGKYMRELLSCSINLKYLFVVETKAPGHTTIFLPFFDKYPNVLCG